ncbi:MAG: glycosyltransferase family 4 protein [Nanoarchaeota archaeon]
MRVCFIQSTFHPFVGGTERQSLQLAQRLIKKGVQVEVVTGRFSDLKKFEVVQGVPVHRVWAYDSHAKRSFLQTLTWLWSAFWFLLFSKSYDIYHAHQALTPAFIAYLIAKLKGKKCLSKIANTQHVGELFILSHSLFGRLMRSFILSMDGFIATSNQAVKELAENKISKEKIAAIPNGVDTEKFKSVKDKKTLRKRLGLPLNKKIVMFLATTTREKGIFELVQAWKTVEAKVSNAHLIIVGKKFNEQELDNLVRKLGLHSIEFLGIHPNPEDFLAASDAFVLCSHAEGLSNALLEAMSSALPIVATKISGTVDLIKDKKNGLLVPPMNTIALSKALLSVLQKPSGWGKAARETIISKYSLDAVVNQYLKLYKNLI